jgi:ATP-dependent Zn protease
MEETAYHEAGHAFMAVFLGGQVHSLTIEPDRDDGPQRFGDAQVIWRRGGMSVKEYQNKQVLVALAGPITESTAANRSIQVLCQSGLMTGDVPGMRPS